LYGIPLDEGLALLDLLVISNGDDRTDHDVVRFELATVFSEDRERTGLVQDDVAAVLELHEAEIVVTNNTLMLGFDLRLLEHTLGGSTDVERTHRELRAGLADRLRGDDTHSFAELDETAGREIATVTCDTNAVLALASEHRADLDFLHARAIDLPGLDFVDLLVGLDDLFLWVERIDDVFAAKAADEAIAELHTSSSPS
jgi:hypothetical protein